MRFRSYRTTLPPTSESAASRFDWRVLFHRLGGAHRQGAVRNPSCGVAIAVAPISFVESCLTAGAHPLCALSGQSPCLSRYGAWAVLRSTRSSRVLRAVWRWIARRTGQIEGLARAKFLSVPLPHTLEPLHQLLFRVRGAMSAAVSPAMPRKPLVTS